MKTSEITNENERIRRPKAAEIKRTVKFLMDFGIKYELSEVPGFITTAELERWKKNEIEKKLNNLNVLY